MIYTGRSSVDHRINADRSSARAGEPDVRTVCRALRNQWQSTEVSFRYEDWIDLLFQ
jgi:hypothetical protein